MKEVSAVEVLCQYTIEELWQSLDEAIAEYYRGECVSHEKAYQIIFESHNEASTHL